jgi:predicted DCC family thiol-disulfide oxidoreductase YuxK
MRSIRQRLLDTYFSFDPRSLALFRVALSLTLLFNLWLRSRVLDSFYTNEGILPNHTLLWAPPTRYLFSFFFSASLRFEVMLWMGLCGLVFVLLLVGYRTKLAQLGTLLAVVSLNSRIAPLENGGDMVTALLCVWSLFLPLGARFSFDALLASLRRRSEQWPTQLNDRAARGAPAERLYSLACCALILQFFAIYLFNVLHKDGPTWLSGEAVHYTLHQDRIVKSAGVWLREHGPVELLRALTWGTMAAETLGALAIISPLFINATRLFAISAMPLMHLGFELFIDVGLFSYTMVAFYPLLITASHWEFLRSQAQRLHRRRRVFIDSDCGFCMMCGRLLARLDVLARFEFASNADRDVLPAGVTLEQADQAIVVVDLESGRVRSGAAAFAGILRSLPGGFLLALPLEAPGLRVIAEWAYHQVASRRLLLSVWLGHAACGLPGAEPAAAHSTLDEPSEAQRLARRARRLFAEACVALYLFAAASEFLNSNLAVPQALRHPRSTLVTMLVQYPRAFQGWGMFAPHAPLEDFMIEVDAVTVDGRHVDPYNELASRVGGPGYREIPALLQQNQFFCGYSLFIWQPHFGPYLTALREWILRYPERTGRPEDRIIRYRVNKLSDRSPPLGQTKPTDFRREPFMTYP